MGEDNSKQPDSNKPDPPGLNISTLKRREIQSPLVACVLNGFIGEIGYEKAMEVASAAIQQDAAKSGKMMVEKYGGNSIKELIRVIREVWADVGYRLSCNRDAPLIRGFNPHMQLLRTRTIMEGATSCDFRITIE